MPFLPPSRNLITQEEVQYKASVSEATFSRIGQSINFIMDRIYDRVQFHWDNYYKVDLNSNITDGLGGKRYIRRTANIAYYYLSNVTAGTAGDSAVNFEVRDNTNTLLGDLFSTAPSINFQAGNETLVGYDLEANAPINSTPNNEAGSLNYTTLQAGWSITPKLISNQKFAKDLYFELVIKEQ